MIYPVAFLLVISVALASVTEPNGLVVPVSSGSGETQLNQLFASRGEAIDWKADASTNPSTWTLNDHIDVKYLLRMAGMVSGLSWYNANGQANPTLYSLIPPGAAVGTAVSGQDIYNSPNYQGGAIGFALVTATNNKYYSQANLNAYCSSCVQPGYWTFALKYRSTLDPYSYYLCWEDGGATSSSWNNDGDFNDDVFLVTGIAPALTTQATSICGNGVVEFGEACDGSACCTSSCTFATSAVTCRAAAGPCDVAETCTGTSGSCPADSFLSGICRASNGPCDVAETCSGNSASCPADTFKSSSVTCRAASGICDVTEKCTGSSAACPTDSFSSSTTVCRASTGVCDIEETCTGSSAICPSDAHASSTTSCRAASGVCDVEEFCDGFSGTCPTDAVKPDTSVCRPAAGLCDVEETCDGFSSSCPFNEYAAPNTVCRASIGPCDPAETCTGYSANCKADVSGNFETTCPGLFVDFNGQTYSWLNFDMISFNNFIANYGDVEGRLAVKNTASIGWGYSVGYEIHSLATDQTLPYSLVVGKSLNFGSGAIYPDGSNVPHAGAKEEIFVGSSVTGPDYLTDLVTGTCSTPGCLDSSFDALQACYGSYQDEMASHADNVDSVIEWSGLYLTCQDAFAANYYVTLEAYKMDTYTWINLDNCNPDARWTVNIPGTDDVSFSGGSFPGNAASIVYNIQGSGRNIRVGNTQLVGTVLAPYNKFFDVGSVVIGKVIAGDIGTSHQTNRAQCFVQQNHGTPLKK